MRNHDQKIRDMARSILPSTARNAARHDKRISSQRARARSNARLRRLLDHHEFDDFEEPLVNEFDDRDMSWDDTLEDRRLSDKVAPLVRWAEVIIERTPALRDGDPRARRAHFARILGDTLIGRHALSHLEHLIGDDNPWEYGRHPDRVPWRVREELRRAEARAAHEERRRLLDEVLSGADTRRLNTRIAALTPPVEELWGLEHRGERIHLGRRGHEPWLFTGDRNRWLTVPPKADAAQAIAFEALRQVHAEMFG